MSLWGYKRMVFQKSCQDYIKMDLTPEALKKSLIQLVRFWFCVTQDYEIVFFLNYTIKFLYLSYKLMYRSRYMVEAKYECTDIKHSLKQKIFSNLLIIKYQINFKLL